MNRLSEGVATTALEAQQKIAPLIHRKFLIKPPAMRVVHDLDFLERFPLDEIIGRDRDCAIG